MVDVSAKAQTAREATAECIVRMSRETCARCIQPSPRGPSALWRRRPPCVQRLAHRGESASPTFVSARAQDMRMPVEVGVRAVLFDYGRTLVTFDYPATELAGVVERYRPAIEGATGRPAPRASEILEKVLLPLEALIENPDE